MLRAPGGGHGTPVSGAATPAAGVPPQPPCSPMLSAQLRAPHGPARRLRQAPRPAAAHRPSAGQAAPRPRYAPPRPRASPPRSVHGAAPSGQAPDLSLGTSGQAQRVGSGGPDRVPPSQVQLAAPPGGAAIHLFGVIHGGNESEVAEFIMRERPQRVVVETSLNAAHGSAHGNTIRRQDCLTFAAGCAPGSHEHRARMFAQYGVQLADMGHPLGSHLWQDLSQGRQALYNEQLVYVAAFAVGADLVFGDRPKQITYARMLWTPSIVDLDQAYAAFSSGNYADLVHAAAPHRPALASANATEAALLGERDAVMLSALHEASLCGGSGGSVVGVVGASHLSGMQRLWDSGRWRDMMAQGLLEAPSGPATPESAGDVGVRHALLDGVIRLSCRTDVQQDVRRVLGRVPPESHEAYSLAHELYGTTRMLLAVLEPGQLAEVCQGWRCDMWEVLAPVRAVRPVNGGAGYDRDLVLELRTLNFEIA